MEGLHYNHKYRTIMYVHCMLMFVSDNSAQTRKKSCSLRQAALWHLLSVCGDFRNKNSAE